MLLAESLLGSSSAAANYIEDVFSTYLYTGTGSAQTITNGIDLSGKGGLVWMKGRSGATDHALYDTARGATFDLASNTTAAQTTQATGLTTFGSTGFSIGALAKINTNAATYASWTFRKQAKFFDIQTWTSANSATARTITHNLGSTPGCVIIKCLGTHSSSLNEWYTVHRYDITAQGYLNRTFAFAPGVPVVTAWTDTTVTFASDFNTGTNNYVVYLFAHDAGGFGASGSDNVISCGSFTTDGSGNATVTLGYEPQWVLVKRSSGTSSWIIVDTMRGFPVGNSNDASLYPNLADAENGTDSVGFPNATGFNFTLGSASSTYIYIAIRRGPMKTPTTGTSVFSPVARTGTGATANVTTSGFAGDLVISKDRGSSGFGWGWSDKLRGAPKILSSDSTNSEASYAPYTDGVTGFLNTGYTLGADGSFLFNGSGYNYGQYYLRRAPGFFDVVCYTGTGSATTFSHNLGVAPELMIFKGRNFISNWRVYSSAIWGTGVGGIPGFDLMSLNANSAANVNNNRLNNTQPTASVFSVGTDADTNGSGNTYVAYLLASVSGVSKAGSYTGTGTTKQIDCGFTGGARFVLIKRTDSTGDWYVWDTARGIVAGNDPYLLLNSTAAEVTSTDYVDTYSAGFELSSTAPAAINANGGTFIFLAIA